MNSESIDEFINNDIDKLINDIIDKKIDNNNNNSINNYQDRRIGDCINEPIYNTKAAGMKNTNNISSVDVIRLSIQVIYLKDSSFRTRFESFPNVFATYLYNFSYWRVDNHHIVMWIMSKLKF